MTAPASAPTTRPLGPPAPAPFDKEDTRRRIRQVDLIALAQQIGVSGLQRVGRDAVGCCPLPGHADGDPSCHFYRDPGRGWFCYGCHCGGDAVTLLREVYGWSFSQALAYLDLGDGARPTFTRLAPQVVRPAQAIRVPLGEPLAIYEYGTYHVCRYVDADGRKTFRQRGPDGRGGWIWHLDGITPRLYHQGEILAAAPDVPVCITEGEKDADALGTLGYLATCNSGGAGRWPETLSPLLAGRKVVIFPDNDTAGRQHAADVAASLRSYATSITIVALPGLPDKGDVSDFLHAHTRDGLAVAIAMTRPLPAVDPDTGELLTEGSAPAEVVTALSDAVSALIEENNRLRAWQQRIRDLFGNDQLDTAHRLTLYGIWEVADEQQIAPGAEAEVYQAQIATKCGQSTATVSRALAAFHGMRTVKYAVQRRPEVGKDPRTGQPKTYWHTHPTLTLTPSVYEPQALVSPISPLAKTGSRHGGYREVCPHCHADSRQQEDTRRCKKCGHVYRPVDLLPSAAAADPLLQEAITGAATNPPAKLQDARQDQPEDDRDVLSSKMQLRELPPPAPSARLPGDLIDTRRAAAVLAARPAHEQRHPPAPVEEPPHPADTELCFTPDAEGPPLWPEQIDAAAAGRAPPQGRAPQAPG